MYGIANTGDTANTSLKNRARKQESIFFDIFVEFCHLSRRKDIRLDRMIMYRILSILAAVLSCCIMKARENDIFFNSLKTEDGLSHHTVAAIYEDENGFIWIGTREGLNMYTGNMVKSFKSEVDNFNSLLYDSVQEICGDMDGNIYIQGSQGVSKYDMKHHRFLPVVHDNVSAMAFREKLYYAVGNRIYGRDGDSAAVFRELAEENVRINTLEFIGDDLWAGTYRHGIFVMSPDSTWRIDTGAEVTDIFRDSCSRIWISTSGRGLLEYSDGKIASEYSDKARPGTGFNVARECCEDKSGYLWIATSQGLHRLSPDTGEMTGWNPEDRPGSLNHSSVTCITCDSSGNIWLGTYFGGVNYFCPTNQIYSLWRQSETEEEGLSFPVVGKMAEDEKGNIWIATEGGGIDYLDRKTGKIRWMDCIPGDRSRQNVKSLMYQDGILWAGTHNKGLVRYDTKSGSRRVYSHDPADSSSIPAGIVYDIIPCSEELLVATFSGVWRFSPDTGKGHLLTGRDGFRTGYTTDLHIDRDSLLWIVTGEHLFSMNLSDGTVRRYFDEDKSSSDKKHNVTLCVYEDSRKNLWVATWGNGLYLLDRETDSFRRFSSQEEGLLSNCVYGIVEAVPGKLVISCNSGYSLLDIDSRQVTSFTARTGLPVTDFNEYSMFRASDGEIFIGSIDGLLSFRQYEVSPASGNRIIPYRLIVNNREVTAGDDTGILEEAMPYTGGLRFNHRQNVFSIQFTTLNYAHNREKDVYYRMKGFSDKWINTNGSNIISYSNLPAGKYSLELSFGESMENEAGYTIPIRIKPPFWQSTPAILLYIIAAASLLYYILRLWKTRVRLNQEVIYEKQRLADNEEKTRFKLNFYTNISHEFKTPLTLITGETEMMLGNPDKLTPENYRRAVNIRKNSLMMKNLIDELLEFRQYESERVHLNVTKNDIVAMLHEHFIIFQPYAKKRGMTFTFSRSVSELSVWYDSRQMQKVVSNLLSNAFKYTQDGGAITMFVKVEDTEVKFGVSDTGRGIPEEDREKIFEYYWQSPISPVETGMSSFGIGLSLCKSIITMHHGKISVDSSPGKGSTFEISLRLGREHFRKEEIGTGAAGHVENPGILPDDTANSLPDTVSGTAEDMSGTIMLIVEDNADILMMLKDAFSPYYSVMTAENGEKALALMEEHLPDIVISDVMMPGISGMELCRRIKSDIGTCHIPVILMTANASVEYNIEGYKTGADDYIQKPFNMRLLRTRCRNLLENRRILQKKFKTTSARDDIMALTTNEMDKKIMDTVMDIIEKNIDNPDFSISTFSSELGMGRTAMFNKIKAITGQTPNMLVLNTRLTRSAVLLVGRQELNIGEISDMVGFSSMAYFSKCFKERYGESPMAWRKKALEKEG